MLPVIIVLFVLFLAAFILNGLSVIDCYKGGYTEPRNTDPIRNKLFFNYSDYAEQIFELINKNNKLLQFTSDIPGRLKKHQEKFSLIRTSTHIGQLKLFLSELEFLTEVLSSPDEEKIVVYAGSAPGNKIYFLHTMFPNVRFILIDPNEHLILFPDGNHYESKMSNSIVYLDCKTKSNMYKVKNRQVNFYNGQTIKIKKEEIKVNFTEYYTKRKQELLDFIKTSNHRFYIVEDYFDNNKADLFAGLNAYFISDIRSNLNDMVDMLANLNKRQIKKPAIITSEEFPGDLDICWNNAMHLNWLRRLQPKKAMLKFRVPWFIQEPEEFQYYAELSPYAETFIEAKQNGVDFVADFLAKKHNFIENEKIYIQAFPGIVSTESRLICSDYDKIVSYDCADYDDGFYYYNWFYRQFAFIDHGFMNAKLGIDGCNDCALMIKIFRDYCKKYKLQDDPVSYVEKLLHVIRRRLTTDFHGMFTEPYKTSKQITNMQELFILTDLYENYKDQFAKFKDG
jgi:hypothetical protein